MTLEVAYLDRDGTINVDRHYLSSVEGFTFCDGALEGLAALRDLGLALVVITNQSGVGRGQISPKQLSEIHDHMTTRLAAEGIHIEGIYACPHRPEDGCICRKPLPGLIHQAEADLGRRRGVMIGDAPRDIAAGQAAGLRTILIEPASLAPPPDCRPDALVPDLVGAAAWLAREVRNAPHTI